MAKKGSYSVLPRGADRSKFPVYQDPIEAAEVFHAGHYNTKVSVYFTPDVDCSVVSYCIATTNFDGKQKYLIGGSDTGGFKEAWRMLNHEHTLRNGPSPVMQPA